jgi:hypothetical protein
VFTKWRSTSCRDICLLAITVGKGTSHVILIAMAGLASRRIWSLSIRRSAAGLTVISAASITAVEELDKRAWLTLVIWNCHPGQALIRIPLSIKITSTILPKRSSLTIPPMSRMMLTMI